MCQTCSIFFCGRGAGLLRPLGGGLGEEARWCARASRLGPHEKLFSGPQKHSLPVKLGAPYMPIDRLKIPAYSLF